MQALAKPSHSCTGCNARQQLAARPAWRRRPVMATAAAASTSSASASAGGSSLPAAGSVQLDTTSACQLAVSIYPMFSYDATGGGGRGTATDLGSGKIGLRFDPAELSIPALNWRTGRLLGIPIPPPLNIAISPSRFEGVLDTATGAIEMAFDAKFEFTVGSLYTAPPLLVNTTLTTGDSRGRLRSGTGRRLASGSARLVGVAEVPPTGDWLLDTFLQLPTDALAIMEATLTFTQ